jgi:hypothetical protein
MMSTRCGARLLTSVCDSWVLLLSAFGGGAAWAFGAPIPISVGTAATMLATAAAVDALTRSRNQRPTSPPPGTPQQALIHLLDGHVRSLRSLQTAALPMAVETKTADAVAAADIARPSVLAVAAAVDALDETISAACKVSGHGEHAAESIRNTVSRLKTRRATLLDGLTAAVDEVATVYAGLLELSATARTVGVWLEDTDVGAVNDSVTLLQTTFAELEADAARLPMDGLT